MRQVGIECDDNRVASMVKAGNQCGSGSVTDRIDQLQAGIGFSEFGDDGGGVIVTVIIDQEKLDIECVFLGNGKGSFD